LYDFTVLAAETYKKSDNMAYQVPGRLGHAMLTRMPIDTTKNVTVAKGSTGMGVCPDILPFEVSIRGMISSFPGTGSPTQV
jgi:hypothetical protein